MGWFGDADKRKDIETRRRDARSSSKRGRREKSSIKNLIRYRGADGLGCVEKNSATLKNKRMQGEGVSPQTRKIEKQRTNSLRVMGKEVSLFRGTISSWMIPASKKRTRAGIKTEDSVWGN